MESESWIRHYFYDLADPRARDRLFMGSPYALILWIVIYVAIVRISKLWMRNRETYDLRKIGIAANVYYIVANGYIFLKVAPYWLNKYNWRCEPLDTSHSMDALQMVTLSHFYTLLKTTYIIESVLGEINLRPILQSNYMLYHHIAVAVGAWIGTNYYPGGHTTFLIFFNCFVHTLMDTYFLFVGILFPELKSKTKLLRESILFLVAIQNLFIFAHYAQLFFWNPCGIPMTMVCILVAVGSSVIIYFLKFSLSLRKTEIDL